LQPNFLFFRPPPSRCLDGSSGTFPEKGVERREITPTPLGSGKHTQTPPPQPLPPQKNRPSPPPPPNKKPPPQNKKQQTNPTPPHPTTPPPKTPPPPLLGPRQRIKFHSTCKGTLLHVVGTGGSFFSAQSSSLYKTPALIIPSHSPLFQNRSRLRETSFVFLLYDGRGGDSALRPPPLFFSRESPLELHPVILVPSIRALNIE